MSKKHGPGMAYDMSKLNKIFAILSVLFLITVFWVFLDDYLRPWKAVQIEAMKIRQMKIDEQIKTAESELNKDELTKLETELEKAKEVVAGRKNDIEKVKQELNALTKDLKEEAIVNGRLNASVSALAYDYGVAHAEHAANEKILFKELQRQKKLFDASKDRVKALSSRELELNRQLASLNGEVISVEKNINEMVGRIDLMKGARKRTEMDAIFALRNSPFVDYLDPTLKIQQVVLKNITDDRYFQHVPKVDRCITCHTFIDQEGFEDQPNPHKTHPNLELMVGKDSPHPMKGYGCTTCHGGEGHRVNDFNSVAHMPQNDEQKAAWIEKYHWHEPHHIASPMLKLNHTEASCIKCHKDVEHIPGAQVLNQSFREFEKFGCYACHKVEGWEHKRKPGPSLERIAQKIDKDFFKSWVWAPKSFNAHSKMPTFFEQTNNSTPEFVRLNIAEVNAMAEFIWSKSPGHEKYEPFSKYKPGNADNGKELIKSVGCLGCHGVEGIDSESKKIDAFAGMYLTATGSKIKNPDWLVSWLKKPSHFQEDTIMPSFRLSDSEANDIATYLLSLKNKKFDNLKFEPLDKTARDEILVKYLTAFDTLEVAQVKLSKMTDHEKTLELGFRSVGKYGCYSCHAIDGFDGRAPIGPELTKIGSKPLTQFGFGHEKVENSRSGWIHAHLLEPTRWDNGADKPFQDLSKMPNFYMTEKQSELITVMLLGMVSDYVPLSGVKRMSANEKIANEGMKILSHYNCIGCHKIDGAYGDITKIFEDDENAGPPWLVNQGHRVNPDWFHHFLDNVYPIRPWLTLRMPSYNLSNDDRNKIVAAFQAMSGLHTFEEPDKELVWEPGERQAALALFDELGCVTCHTTGFNQEEPLAPDLHYSKRRMRTSWIKKWLENPQAILPYTTMTNFWEDGVSQAPDILDGDKDRQINALTKYLIEISSDRFSPLDVPKPPLLHKQAKK